MQVYEVLEGSRLLALSGNFLVFFVSPWLWQSMPQLSCGGGVLLAVLELLSRACLSSSVRSASLSLPQRAVSFSRTVGVTSGVRLGRRFLRPIPVVMSL